MMTLAACSGSGGATVGAASASAGNAASPKDTTSAGSGDPSSGSLISYDAVSTILRRKCVSCHGSSRSDAGLELQSWEKLISGSSFGEAVIAFAPANSRLIQLSAPSNGTAHPAELGADTLTEDEVKTVHSWIARGAPSSAGEIPFSKTRNLVYVTNQGDASLSIVDASANVVARRIDLTELGFSKTAKPHHVAVEPDGAYWYVSLIGENRVVKFDAANRIVGVAQLEVPGLLILDSDHGRLYVGRSMSAVNAPSSIGVIRTSDLSVDEIDVFIPRPHALSVTPAGEIVFTASLSENTVAVVNINTEEVDLLRLGGNPEVLVQFAIAPDGQTMVAGGQLSGQLHLFYISNPAAISVADAVTIGGGPWHPVYSLDGRQLYVPNKMANTITVLDTDSRSVSEVISGAGFAEPHGTALSPDGRYLYVSNNNQKGTYTPRHTIEGQADAGTVVVVDTRTNELIKVLEVGSNPTGVGARRPHQHETGR